MVKFYHPANKPREFDMDAFLNAPSPRGRHVHMYDVLDKDDELIASYLHFTDAWNFANDPTENPAQNGPYKYVEAYTRTDTGHIWEDDFGHIPGPERSYLLRDVAQDGEWVAQGVSQVEAAKIAATLEAINYDRIAKRVTSYATFVELRDAITARDPDVTANIGIVAYLDPATGKRVALPATNSRHSATCTCARCVRKRNLNRKRTRSVEANEIVHAMPSIAPMPFQYDMPVSGVASDERRIGKEWVPAFSAANSASRNPNGVEHAFVLFKVSSSEWRVVNIGQKRQILRMVSRMTPRQQLRYRAVPYAQARQIQDMASTVVVHIATGRVVYRGTRDQIRVWAETKVREYAFDLAAHRLVTIHKHFATVAAKKAAKEAIKKSA